MPPPLPSGPDGSDRRPNDPVDWVYHEDSATAHEAVDPVVMVQLPAEPEVPETKQSPFPEVGDRLLYFHLMEELGRGSFGRVYLARQQSLANRLVALKVTQTPSDEPQRLARLQHPNIVPVHSVHQVGNFQAICMPYLGRVTLARLMANLGTEDGRRPDSGRDLLSTLMGSTRPTALARDLDQEPTSADDSSVSRPIVAGPLEALGEMSFVEAALWITAQLAAGLGHAHRHGVYHRDLKPANVLLTDDGVPMLLDFNTSVEAPPPGGDDWVGGTPQYMPQEQLRAFLGEHVIVDARSDLYSLGTILYELLAGKPPYPQFRGPTPRETAITLLPTRRSPPPPPSTFNPAVPPAVDAIALKLLDPDPERRYRTADALREDLERQLDHRPLRYAPDRSIRERFTKWRRRHPQLATGLAVTLAVLLFVVTPLTAVAIRQTQHAARARHAERLAAAEAFHQATADLRHAAVLLASRTDASQDDGMQLAETVLARYELPTNPAWMERPLFARLDAAQQQTLRESLGEVLILMTRVETQRAAATPEALAAAARWNALAQQVFPAPERPAIVERQQRELEARRTRQPLPSPEAPATDMDLYFEGLDLVVAGRYREGLATLTTFCDRHPEHFPGWYARGVCHGELRQYPEAITAYSVCIALRPDFRWAYLGRGHARLKMRRWAEADTDLTRALELQPDWAPALLNRALAREGLKRLAEAEADLTTALRRPDAPTRLYFLRHRIRAAQGDGLGAEADRIAGLTREPQDPVSWATRGFWRANQEPQQALADVERALQLAPSNRDALLNKAVLLAEKLGRLPEAVETLDDLLKLYPDDLDARAGRGIYQARLGHAAEARRDAAATLASDSSAFRLYQMAGLYAQLARLPGGTKDRAEAHRLLARALAAGFADFQLLRNDPDLEPIRQDRPVQELVRAAESVRSRAR